jgi:transcriptional/translational regulatory protein YebC/TACO1
MNKTEIYDLLDTIYEANFLDSIEIITEEESKYKKSEFYKQTKVPLATLCEKYFHWRNSENSIKDELLSFVYNLDEDAVVKTLTNLIKKLESSEDVQRIVEAIAESLDPKDLKNLSEEFQETVSKLK